MREPLIAPATRPVDGASDRAHEIDGIRGWASLLVLFSHAFSEMLKFAVPSVRSPWLAPLFAGDLAVAIFFVLSGDALSIAYFGGGRVQSIDRLLVRRYQRLTAPILLSCVLTYAIMKAGLDFHFRADEILQRPDWLGSFLRFPADFLRLVKFSLIDVYSGDRGQPSYGPFLWTMPLEMLGSMLIFLLCYVWRSLKAAPLACAVLAVWFCALGSSFGLFAAGMLFGYWRSQGAYVRLFASRTYQLAALATVAAVIATLILTANRDRHWSLIFVLGTVAVFCFYTQTALKRFFSNGLSRFLGDISFPLYLIHFQVLISLMSWLVVRDHAIRGEIDQPSMLMFASIAVSVSLAAAWLFRQVERAALRRLDALTLRVLA